MTHNPVVATSVRPMGGLYPTPSPSPTVSCPTSPPRTAPFQPTLPPTSESILDDDQIEKGSQKEPLPIKRDSVASTQHVAKKRKSKPIKAIAMPVDAIDREGQGIVSLDVYHLYLLDPKSLVFQRKIRRLASSYSSSFLSASSAESIMALPYREDDRGSNGERKLMPPPVLRPDFDMSPYQYTVGAPIVLWKKGSSLTIPPNVPFYDTLTAEEIRTCSALRILPDQYLHIKQTILSAAETRGPFKKRDAKSWFRIDVNKTAVLFDWFRSLGWIPSEEEWEKKTAATGVRRSGSISSGSNS